MFSHDQRAEQGGFALKFCLLYRASYDSRLERPTGLRALPLQDQFGSLTLYEAGRALSPHQVPHTPLCRPPSPGTAHTASPPPLLVAQTATLNHSLGPAGPLVRMPRRKRASPTQEEARTKRQKTVVGGGRRKEAESVFTSKRCVAWFHEYTGPDEDVIGPEGMEKFCEDLGVEPENIVMLCLAWKLDAKQMGFFTKAEWLRGMTDLSCDTMTKLQARLEYLRSLLDDPTIFKNIYRYAFDFAKEKDQRSLDMDTAKAMLGLLLGRTWSLFGTFHQFLEQTRYKVLNKDQWYNVLEFSRLINTDLSNYDEDGAWPVLLDEFVEWYKDQRGLTTTTPVSSDHNTSSCASSTCVHTTGDTTSARMHLY